MSLKSKLIHDPKKKLKAKEKYFSIAYRTEATHRFWLWDASPPPEPGSHSSYAAADDDNKGDGKGERMAKATESAHHHEAQGRARIPEPLQAPARPRETTIFLFPFFLPVHCSCSQPCSSSAIMQRTARKH